MIELAEAEKRRERAFLVGFLEQNGDPDKVREQLEELAELVRSLNMIPLEPEIARIRTGQVQYHVGTGKAEEIARMVQECEADLLVFDDPITPSQQRNWERLTQCPVLDREEIILDIFAERAQTKEAVLQVELARAQYQLPRVKRAWTHLSRQRGGGATNRGEGEAQIETDRRLLRKKIQQLTEELAAVRKQRGTQRKQRLRRPVPQAAIVGYTNVGKSSLLQALSGAEILVKDQLFATLDPTARRVELGNNLEMVLTDTVGFVRKLPHSLVEAFKSTLEEAALADLLLLVLDLSGDDIDNEWETTLGVLKELGADEKRIQVVFNKCDLVDSRQEAVKLARLRGLFPGALYVSCHSGAGLPELKAHLAEFASAARTVLRVKLPPVRSDLAALAHQAGHVYEAQYDQEGFLEMVIAIEEKYQHKFSEFLQ